MPVINLPPAIFSMFQKLESRLQKLEYTKRFTAPIVDADPSRPNNGDIWFNSNTNLLKFVDENATVRLVTPSQVYGRSSSTSATQSFTTATDTQITAFDSSAGNGVTVGAGSLTINTAGRYMVNARVTWTANVTGLRRLRLLKGATQVAIDLQTPSSTLAFQNTITLAEYVFAAGDVLTLYGYQNSGGALSLNAGLAEHSFSATYLGAV